MGIGNYIGTGYGTGNGYGNGYGYGDGSCYGSGYGSGYGYGYGSGETMAALAESLGGERAAILKAEGATIALWRSDSNGKPANGGKKTVARVGLVEEVGGPLELCTHRALHATLNPGAWKGDRLWVVALYPPVEKQDDKMGSLKREILAEISPNPWKGA